LQFRELGIERANLPKVLSSAEHYGVVTNGELKGISIDSCIGD
jgi:glycerol kinase